VAAKVLSRTVELQWWGRKLTKKRKDGRKREKEQVEDDIKETSLIRC
jgi:predicted nuclease of restriction endonuclease-like (RecB) superfamily